MALDSSSFVNQAYMVLSDPIERSSYLLKLSGCDMSNQDKSGEETLEFLSEMMTLNENIEKTIETLNSLDLSDASLKAKFEANLTYLYRDISYRFASECKLLNTCLRHREWANAKLALSRAKYFGKLRDLLHEIRPLVRLKNLNVDMY
ncbi:unnamed protein product [Protopolystoma xenopodis]|uniref:Co-chaperone HscB C-terminal oligomerisation domain-containing protein n=1 Tax=Protopolystoma xenopodis TaxID=117903 RepID=A0A3S5BDW4_9PLAT|nr:unnamed protein product [Protopolystoma xenopodis]